MDFEDIQVGDTISFHFNSNINGTITGTEQDFTIHVTNMYPQYHVNRYDDVGAFGGRYADNEYGSIMMFYRPFVTNITLLRRVGPVIGTGISGGNNPRLLIVHKFYLVEYRTNTNHVRQRICKVIAIEGTGVRFYNYHTQRHMTLSNEQIHRAVEVAPLRGNYIENELEYLDVDEQYIHTEAGNRWVELNAPKPEYPVWQGPRLVREWSGEFVV